MDDDARPQTAADDLKHVLDVARAAVDREFQRAERFDAKARGQATLAGSWFAVTQAVVAVALRSETPHCWIVAILVVLLLQGSALILLLAACARVWRLRERNDIGSETIAAMRGSAGDADFADRAVQLYSGILEGAQEANGRRADALESNADHGWRKHLSATSLWWAVLGIGLLELGAVVASRVI